MEGKFRRRDETVQLEEVNLTSNKNVGFHGDDAALPGNKPEDISRNGSRGPTNQQGANSHGTEHLTLNEGSERPRHKGQGHLLLLLVCLLVLIIFILLIIIGILYSGTVPKCTTPQPVSQSRSGIFDSLSQSELETVRDYMIENSNLNLVNIDNAQPNNSYIFLIDLQVPNKAKVLDYLDKNGAKPDRVAKVFVTRGDRNPPIIEEYLVNLDKKTHELYKNPSYSRDPIPHSARLHDSVEYQYTNQLYKTGLKKVERILLESYNAKYTNCTKGKENCLIAIDIAPKGRVSGERKTWVFLLRDVHGYYLHPVGFQIQINHEGTDPSQWFIEQFYYNDKVFKTADELLTAYDTGRVQKVKIPFPSRAENDHYSSLNQRGPPSGEALRPPVLVYPDGARYKIHGHQVTYMNWRFDFRMDPSTGIRLFDVRFKNERIVYELANIDAIVLYSGHNPMQGIVNFFDASWLMGVYSFELAKGIDCPDTATYFNFPFYHNSHRVKMNRNSMCLFEHDNGLPLGRHFSADFVSGEGYRNYAGMHDYVLVLRYIPVIWNYDYIIDFIFHQDGVLEARVATSGYLQTTFYSQKEEKYAYKIQDHVVGPMHHHVLNFKADVDVAGTQNRFATLNIKIENVTYPWAENQYKVQKYFEKQDYPTEQQALIKYDFNAPKYYFIYNNQSRNKLGYSKGMRVKLSGMSKVMIPFDNYKSNPVNGAAQSQYQLAATRQKDSEISSTSIYTQNDPYNPVVDFNTFIEDDENLLDEDIVLWATLGVHHIPSIEDVPVTTTSSNRASLYLIPYNYHDVNPIVNSRDLISVEPNGDLSDFKVQRNQVKEGLGCYQENTEKFSYNGTNSI